MFTLYSLATLIWPFKEGCQNQYVSVDSCGEFFRWQSRGVDDKGNFVGTDLVMEKMLTE